MTMKRILIALCLLLAAAVPAARATALFPFFVDLVGDYTTLVDGKSFMARGLSTLGSKAATESFMADVIPDDVSVERLSDGVTIYRSVFKSSDPIPADDRVYAIYLIATPGGCEVYVTESTAIQQKEYESEIVNGKLGS